MKTALWQTKNRENLTYPQLLIQNAATAPGSIFNRQSGSIFNRRQHISLKPHQMAALAHINAGDRIRSVTEEVEAGA
jgi:hypothetical protein